jgi:hypothetical protein
MLMDNNSVQTGTSFMGILVLGFEKFVLLVNAEVLDA